MQLFRIPQFVAALLIARSDRSRKKSTGWDSNPRRRCTRAESWPLDDQCLSSIRNTAEVGSEGLEPSPVRLRAGCAAANTSIPCCCLRSQSARTESNRRRALIRSLLSPLSYGPQDKPSLTTRCSMRPEGFEPSPFGLKDRCAAVTPRPRAGRGHLFQMMQREHISLHQSSPRRDRTFVSALSGRRPQPLNDRAVFYSSWDNRTADAISWPKPDGTARLRYVQIS